MIFGTLNRYFFLRYAITTGWFFVGVTAIVFLADFSENAGRLSGLPGYTVAIGLLMTAVRLPLILQQTMPFLVLFVGMTTLIALNRRYELVIARAAGISVWQFMAPFIFGAFIVGLLTMLVLNPIAAAGQRQADALEADLRGDPSYHNRLSVPWLRQIARDDDVIIGAKTVVDNGMTLMNAVFIHFNPQGDVVLRQDANSAKLEDGYWLLTGVVERAPGEIPAHKATVRVRTNLKQDFVSQRLAQPETIAFYDLSNRIEIARSFGISTKALETQFNSLLSQPFLMVAMTLIAATVSLKFSRFNQSRSVILGGILAGFVLYVVNVLVKAFGSSGVVPPFVATWIPVVVALALGATILLHQEDG
ncbi:MULTISPECIES: LPS export ABC transporter permease LptG [unclassified Rhizobium]|uniref:LPS export ABC transporter permease LptG n=1 Tax=unclassified Rhizobium TaxID=2613769 RepID=UPI0011608129|nr:MULTISPECIES: LPS export ABC transporter permease LptG [unclassified Rhizobium]MBO9097965.1 LPS export ABC transporter permease LptG [Rhizobium sp. L58/93]MBO9133252.1 LPS export ABC transporter permease LptG [Rhizobium sp. B209b/85]MBO9168116.1 LPS export ABC transporter permease LptG [Rhizobium sp. L245/93]MBO9184161.1 LPS export ABC transporter permease LptG [Rhizobium sp. E27B/91]MBZ5760148.1 LPS export ABC transporter permease LptG [Rhizobium sp. VS19-DR96]